MAGGRVVAAVGVEWGLGFVGGDGGAMIGVLFVAFEVVGGMGVKGREGGAVGLEFGVI